jgi:hypothetical protein
LLWILIAIPVITPLIGLLLYRQVGKKEFLKLDIVQFVYAFILGPIAFVWMKSMLFFLSRNDLGTSLSLNQLFFIDTAFSVIFLYLSAFIAIHSLTKTFEVKLQKDPLFDILEHSEKFHLWISHTSIYTLGGLIFMLLGLINLFLPLAIELTRTAFFLILLAALILGFILYAGIWLSNFTASKFLRLVQLIYGFFFVIQIFAYFFVSPSFSGEYIVFWFIIMIFASMVFSFQVISRSQKSKTWINKLHHKHHEGWSEKNFLLILDKLDKLRPPHKQ